MILGMSTAAFTTLHVAISLVAIAAGLVDLSGMLAGRRLPLWTAIFLITTVATSASGFLFHSVRFGPPHAVGLISLVVLAFTIAALYNFQLAGGWRPVYVVGAICSLYLNVFVGIVQAFQKLPSLRELAPTQAEPPFVAAQALALALFVGLTVVALRCYRPRTA